MLYFAYGSNLDPDQMRRRSPDHVIVGMAALHDHRLGFPRYSADWEGGVSSPQPVHGETLWGMVYEVTAEDMVRLDDYEGRYGPEDPRNAYDREVITVELVRPDDGSPPRRLRVNAFVARPGNPTPPSRRYLDTILGGARHHRLPEDYVTRLAALDTRSGDGAPGSM